MTVRMVKQSDSQVTLELTFDVSGQLMEIEEGIQDVLNESIRFDLIPNSSRYLRIAAVRWDTGFLRYFTNEDMSRNIIKTFVFFIFSAMYSRIENNLFTIFLSYNEKTKGHHFFQNWSIT